MYFLNNSKGFFKMNKIFYVLVVLSLLMLMVSCASPVDPDQERSLMEMAKLLPNDGSATNNFGFSVAIDGNTAIVGAYLDFGGENKSNIGGSAYIFIRSGGTWIQEAKLKANDFDPGDQFGFSVAINGDTAIVGANADGSDQSGAAYIFTRRGTAWNQEAKINAGGGFAFFGYSVAIANDTIIVGTKNTDKAYVFTRNGNNWTRQATLTDSIIYDQGFGNSVAINGDTAIVGTPNEVDPATRIYGRGAVYVFTRNGTNWTEQAKLIASDAAAEELFGYSVAIDGNTLIVGAAQESESQFVLRYSGAAYIFTRDGTNWIQQAKLKANDAASGDVFGWSVAINGDSVLVGVARDDNGGSDSGSAYLFTRSGTTWSEQRKLLASDSARLDYFGSSVAISSDYAIVGAFGDDDDGTYSGSAYIFQMP